jgi:ATP-dependent RNA helicase DeaD
MTFKELGIDERILSAITEMGFEIPMPVQQEVIPFLLQDTRDLVALAHTGTGKTAAYGIPIIQQINPSSLKTQALVLAPTRELCLQITDDLTRLGQHIENLNIVAIYGGANIFTQIKQVGAGAQIIVATPGRMLDMLKRKKVNVSAINWLVLDEADEMLDMGFKEDLNAILTGTPDQKRVLLFSATMPSEIEAIAKSYMKKPKEITIGSRNKGAENIQHQYYVVHAKDRYKTLKRIADYYPDIYAIIFCRTKIETQEVADSLIKDGYNADALHGDLSQAQRDSVMNRFRTRNLQMLVATDVAARGIDVTNLTHIINYNLPDDIENYTHRSGRTGRAGKSGISIVIINLKEAFRIKQIEKQIGKKFDQVKIPTGRDVCERQLLHLIEKVKNTEIQHKEIGVFLPAVYEQLKGISKEEIIQKFVSAEFNRFLSYYRHAADINVEMRKESDRTVPNSKTWSGAGSSSVRLFINLGQMEKFNDRRLKAYLFEMANIPNLRISHVEVTRSCSFFETDSQQSDFLMAKFKKEKFQGRHVQVGYADKGKRKKGKERCNRDYSKATNAFFALKRKRR